MAGFTVQQHKEYIARQESSGYDSATSGGTLSGELIPPVHVGTDKATELAMQAKDFARMEAEYRFDQIRIDKAKQAQNFEITDADAEAMEEMIRRKREKKKLSK